MFESMTVTVGLDVHARSVRLAAVRADELLEERTLPYDHDAVERVLRGWPAVRCCYEAGPTGFGLYRYLVGRGIECAVAAPGLVPQRPGERVKTDPRDARKLARLHAGGLLQPIYVPSRELEAARDLVRAREDARLDRMRDRLRLSKFCLRHGRRLPSQPVARRPKVRLTRGSGSCGVKKLGSPTRVESFAVQATAPATLQALSERMMGLEPTTFCMAKAGRRSRPFAQTPVCRSSCSSERTAANPNERRVQPVQPL
jgi:transposase